MIPVRLRAHMLALLLSSFVVSELAQGASAITSVPPAEYKAVPERKAAAALILSSAVPAARITLSAPTSAERDLVKTRNAKLATTNKELAKGVKGRPLAIGYGRSIPAASQRIAVASLPWQTLADGTRAAKLQIVSPDAAALRVALQLSATDPDLSVRFSGNAPNAEVFGPIPANTIADDTARFGMFWSPTLDGDVATIEFHADAGAKIGGATLIVPRIAHHLLAGAALRSPDMKTVSDIGTSGACEIDVACVAPQTTAFVNSTKSVAQLLFTQEDGVSYLCTGTLLNDSITSGTPYLFTANHCINSALAARTLNTFWFFDAVACGNHTTVPAYVQKTGGAALLARSEDWDWALVRLNEAPPPGAVFSAWRSDIVTGSTTVAIIHHPQGDLKKWAQGFSRGYQTYSDGSSFIQVQYSQGTTEGGSSGAALLTLNGSGFYEVRGGLFGGLASCDQPSGLDVYSRFDNLLPLVRQYLTPGNNPSNTVVAVEFYNKSLQHYFISTAAAEINDLDTGVQAGWERTGFRFLAYETPVAGTNPVCRFYLPPAHGDSHFYSASPKECADTAAAHATDWIYESPAAFYIALPNTTTGACPAGTLPVWRFFNQLTTNYRYTADVTTRDDMSSQPAVWIAEGYGPGPSYPSMCTPVALEIAASATPTGVLNVDQQGLTGIWYEPATSGQGFGIEVYPDLVASGTGFAQLSWFTFDSGAAGGADKERWYTASGALSGSTTASLAIYQNTGGNFNAGPITAAQQVGTGTLAFTACNAAQLTYSFADGSGRSGVVPLTRITPNVTCSTTSARPTNADFALSGNWFDRSTSGQGFFFEVNPNSPVFYFAWYTYAPDGQAAGAAGERWYTGQTTYQSGARTFTMPIYQTTGGIFDTNTPAGQSTVQVGTATVTFASCTSATLTYAFTSGTNSGLSGTIALTRVGPTPIGCVG